MVKFFWGLQLVCVYGFVLGEIEWIRRIIFFMSVVFCRNMGLCFSFYQKVSFFGTTGKLRRHGVRRVCNTAFDCDHDDDECGLWVVLCLYNHNQLGEEKKKDFFVGYSNGIIARGHWSNSNFSISFVLCWKGKISSFCREWNNIKALTENLLDYRHRYFFIALCVVVTH